MGQSVASNEQSPSVPKALGQSMARFAQSPSIQKAMGQSVARFEPSPTIQKAMGLTAVRTSQSPSVQQALAGDASHPRQKRDKASIASSRNIASSRLPTPPHAAALSAATLMASACRRSRSASRR
ncbi:hypothetical protein [Cohnella sp. GCM10012308]|uniref:hypothetical protein n=1 Tax=Cohnella sp. GCM10012308 TaxID=3317329 RepID=UPI00361F187D